MSTEGIINTVLQAWGVISEPITMLYTYGAVYIGLVFKTLPFMILPLYSNLQKIDKSVLEVGRDLGATSVQLFWKVILPISLPGLST
jgi:spermidine/putrescine transport system permease protein